MRNYIKNKVQIPRKTVILSKFIGIYYMNVTGSFKFVDICKKGFYLYPPACNIKPASETSSQKTYFQNLIDII